MSDRPSSANAAGSAAVRRARVRLVGLAVALTLAGVVLVGVIALNARDLADWFDRLGAAAVPAMALCGAVLVVLMVPGGLVAGAAGFVSGTPVGTLVAVIATSAGAGAAAAIGRWLATPSARYAFGGRVERAVAWFEGRPARSVITARLVPGAPFNVTSYVLGLTRIPLHTIVAGTAVGFAPRCFAYAALGGSLRDLGRPEATAAIIASAALLVAVLLAPRLALGNAARGAGNGRAPHG